MKITKVVISSLFALSLIYSANINGQVSVADIAESPGKAGGIYFAYPVTESLNTPVPKGYKPFYISHYGRHGSRYLISDRDYTVVIDRLRHAQSQGALTPLGEDVLARLDTVWAEAQGRGGELTPLGYRQHKGIANRMYQAFPEVFAPGASVKASSTVVMRCAHSMFAFIEGLKENAPYLEIPRESGQRNMYFLNYHSPESGPYSNENGPWYQTWKRFRQQQTNPHRLIKSLFADQNYVDTWVDPVELMWQLYWVTVDMQNMETPIQFTDIFTTEELYDLWKVFNFNFFACNSSYAPAKGLHIANANNLIDNIVEEADAAIAAGSHGATLRFGHDGNIIPLTAQMGIEGCFTDITDPNRLPDEWADFKISPMAANLQLIFFKNPKTGDILVKVMLNEREVRLPVASDTYPFYPWPELRQYLKGITTVVSQ